MPNPTIDRAHKPTREQQRAFIVKYFPKYLPSVAAKKLLAKNDPNFTEAGLFKFLSIENMEPEFAIYCWLKAMKNKYDSTRQIAPIDKPDFDTPEPSSFAPQTTSLDNWLNATIAQDLLDIDRQRALDRQWDIRHWLAIVLAIEVLAFGGFWMRDAARFPVNSQQVSQK